MISHGSRILDRIELHDAQSASVASCRKELDAKSCSKPLLFLPPSRIHHELQSTVFGSTIVGQWSNIASEPLSGYQRRAGANMLPQEPPVPACQLQGRCVATCKTGPRWTYNHGPEPHAHLKHRQVVTATNVLLFPRDALGTSCATSSCPKASVLAFMVQFGGMNQNC